MERTKSTILPSIIIIIASSLTSGVFVVLCFLCVSVFGFDTLFEFIVPLLLKESACLDCFEFVFVVASLLIVLLGFESFSSNDQAAS